MQKSVESRSMALLLKDVRRTPLLSPAEERVLADRVRKSNDRQAFDRLVQANMRFVVKVAHGYKGYGLPLADLVQEGSLGLTVAVSKFEPERGFRLISYAVWWVRAFIQNYVMHAHSLVKLGTTQAQRRLFFKLRSARERIEQMHREAPLDGGDANDLIAKALNVRAHEVSMMRGRMAGKDASLDAPLGEDRTETRLDALTDESAVLPEAHVATAERDHGVRSRVQAAMKKLNIKEQYIVSHRLWCDEPCTLQAVGNHFSISRERARQIECAVVRKMRHVLREFVAPRPYAPTPAAA